MKRGRKQILFGLGIGLSLLCAVGAFGVWSYYRGQAVCAERVVLLPTGCDFDRFSDSVRQSGALCRPSRFLRIARQKGLDHTLRAGRYVLKPGMSYVTLIRRFQLGLQDPVRVTFHNVRTLDRLSGSLSRKIEADSVELARLLTDSATAARYGYTPQTFMAMFIPNTYEFYWNVTPEELLQRLHKESEQFWKSRDAQRAQSGLSRTEVMTLASIVYEETKRTAEMPTVAGVYLNRLRIGMPLQADPTVKFALGDFSLRRVLHRHLEVDSPYNTYKYAGLPPGPICMPSIAAIDAVLHYEAHAYLYFCAKADLSGGHVFARTLPEHHRNAVAYAAALNRLKIK